MKVDETFESVNRLWQELSVIVVVHATALALAIYAGVTPARTIVSVARSAASLPELEALRSNLQHIGLDLPLVAAAAIVVYVVLFQRVRALILHLPFLRLRYSQIALWRAGKCFEELRQLSRWFQGYTASAALADLEVTLGLAITQTGKEFKEYHQELIETPEASAAGWTKYYSGFCLLALVSLLFIRIAPNGVKSGVLPIGLFLAALMARCGWEAQIERLVVSRLRFAIDCGIVSGAQNEKVENPKQNLRMAGLSTSFEVEPPHPLPVDGKRLLADVKLAEELVMLPPPCLPYQYFWALHCARQIWPFKRAGSLSVIRNEMFRSWFYRSVIAQLGVRPESGGYWNQTQPGDDAANEFLPRPDLSRITSVR